MALVAHKRLLTEYKTLTTDPPDGITAGPANEDNMFLWEALIQGPEGTPFEGGIFPAELKFPKDYPLAPPSMRFTCDMWHPNGTAKSVALLVHMADVSLQYTQTATYASPSCMRLATTPTSTNTQASDGVRYNLWKRF